MVNRLSISVVSAATLIAAAASALSSASASAATAPVTDPEIAVHFDFAKGQTPENIALAPDGAAYVTFAKARQVAEITRDGKVQILATLPAPADGGVHTPSLGFPLTSGIVRAEDGTLYFLYATGTADLTGVWRLRRGGRPRRIAALPADGLPNGLALDACTHTLYVTDSTLSTIWRVSDGAAAATAWSTAPELADAGYLGANGVKVHNGAVWTSNLDKGTVLRIPILPDGRAGQVQTRVTGLQGIDDFAFVGRGDRLLAAIDPKNEVALVQPDDGSYSIVLTAADGLQNPTSIAVRRDTVYVNDAAYLTGSDPNLLIAHLGR
jgi:hypothetical protein